MNIKLSLSSLLSLAMLLFFFMPWLQVAGGLVNYTGYEIPYTGKTLAIIFSTDTYLGNNNWSAYLAYLLYLLPAMAAYNIFRDLQKQKSLFVLSVLIPLVPLLIFISMFIKLGMGAFDHYDIGLYLSVLLGLVMLLHSFGLIGFSSKTSRR